MSTSSKKAINLLIILIILGAGGALTTTACLYLYLSPKLPSAEELQEIELQIPLRIHSQDFKIIAEFGEKKRSPVAFEEIPQSMIDAFLAAEDDRFFDHRGVDITGLARAALELVSTGSIQSGGSTITMQVARNFFLNNKQEFTRKFNEILLAFRIEDELTKEEIFSLYANKIYLGNRAYGVGAAAQVYYGKSLQELSLPEVAMIAGLPKAPSKYNPLANPTRALQRRDWILGRMLTLGTITDIQHKNAIAQQDTASYHGSITELSAAYPAEMVRQEIINKFGLKAYTEGYQAITTLDSKLQKKATAALQKGLLAYDQRHGYRGPEQKQLPEDSWQQALRNSSTYGGLEPAIVTDVLDDHLLLITTQGHQLQLNWSDGLETLRLFKTINSRSAPITSANDIFSRGDLIRIKRQGNGSVTLTQLPQAQAALVALSPKDGAIRSLVGGFDFQHSRFNRASQALRQPGSNFKPFIYATALSTGFTPATLINDAPVVFNDVKLEDAWRPENDSGKFYGPTRLREALYKSRNLVSIRLLRRMGIDRTLSGIANFGFNTSEMPLDLSLALGSHVLTPLQVATGYATFANGGYRVSPYLLDKVIDRHGNIIYQAKPDTVCKDCENDLFSNSTRLQADNPTKTEKTIATSSSLLDDQLEQLLHNIEQERLPENESVSWEALQQALQNTEIVELPQAKQILDPQTAFLIDSILKDVITRGTGTKAKVLNRSDIAGKTGTTNGPRDAWFSGYSPHLTTTAWVGFDDNSTLGRNEYGGSAALPIWIDFMGEALKGKPEFHHPQPEGVVMVKIDPKTSQRVQPHEKGIFEFFRTENVPNLVDEQAKSGESGDVLPGDLF